MNLSSASPSERVKSVVLLSGGLDSAVTLAIAREAGFDCYCLSLDYGQRHRSELKAAARVAQSLDACEHRIVQLPLDDFGGSALTDATIKVPTDGIPSGIPITYVPARNTIMLSLALAWAEILHSRHIYIGVNAVDYSGYPDCRPEYIAAFEKMANLATKSSIEGRKLQIVTPIINLPKAKIIRKGYALGVDYSLTVSCYLADEQGHACGYCDSCRLRREGFVAAGISDPVRYRDAN